MSGESTSLLYRPIGEQLAEHASPPELIEFLARHRLLGVASLLHERGLLSYSQAALASSVVRQRPVVTAAQIREEARVLTAFAGAGLPVLALKGCALAHSVYPAPDQRWRADLDILVSPDSVSQARDGLIQLGYRPMWTVAGGTPMDQESWLLGHGTHRRVIDLHWKLRNHPVLRDRLGFDEQWAASIELPSLGPGARGQGTVHALLNAVMHWFDDLYNQRRPLGWLLDIDLLWRLLDAQGQSELIRLAEERELAGLLAECLQRVTAVWATPIPPQTLAALQHAGRHQLPTRLIRAGRNPWRAYLFALRCEPDMGTRLRRLRHSLFPPTTYMRERYGVEGLALLASYWYRLKARGKS
ncbi:MAG: nucleotidyltransferase family protein [Wenzhouxiangella sp.]